MVEKLKEALHTKHGLKSATVLLVVTLFLSNVLGLVRNIVLATSANSLTQLDPYYAAFRLPDLIFNILILGAISSAFIPVYAETRKELGEEASHRLANTLLGTLLVVVAVGIVIIWLLAPIAIASLVPTFNVVDQAHTVHLTRIMLLSPFFFTLSYVAGGVLNARKRFFSYSIAPLVYNVSIICGALLMPHYGVEGVAWAVAIGALLHFSIQIPTLLAVGYKMRPRVSFNDVLVRRIVMLTIPRTFSLGIAQVALLAFTVLASRLRPGALTIFSLTNDFQTTPAIIFGASLATAVFPTLSESVAEKNEEKFQRNLHRTLRVSVFTVIPLAMFVFLLRAQITRLYIGLGSNIGWEETIRAIHTLGWFAFSFLAQAFVFILARAFYALQDTRRPMYAALIGTCSTILLAILLPRSGYFSAESGRDVASLAAAYSVGIWIQAVLLLTWLPARWRGNLGRTSQSAYYSLAFSVVAGAVLWISLRILGEGLHVPQVEFSGVGTHTILSLFIQASVSAIMGTVVYIGLASIFRLEELKWVIGFRKNVAREATAQID